MVVRAPELPAADHPAVEEAARLINVASEARSARVSGEEVRRINYFSDVTPQEADRIAALIQVVSVPPGEQIIVDGAPGHSMYLLLQGQVEVSKRLFVKSDEGFEVAEKALIRLESKDPPPEAPPRSESGVQTLRGFFAFGEMALFDPDSRRSASVTATTPCRLGRLENEDFLRLSGRDTRMGSRVLKSIARKLNADLHRADQDIANLVTAFSYALER